MNESTRCPKCGCEMVPIITGMLMTLHCVNPTCPVPPAQSRAEDGRQDGRGTENRCD